MSILGQHKLAAIREVIGHVESVPGALAECGVYKGGILRLLGEHFPARTVYGFDTFSGLPAEMHQPGEPHAIGDFSDTTLDAVRASVSDLLNVRIVPGIFPASAAPMSSERFAFVHLDMDYYASTRAALVWFLTRMSSGGVIVLDDYDWKHCPGVSRAVNELGLVPVETGAEYQRAVWF